MNIDPNQNSESPVEDKKGGENDEIEIREHHERFETKFYSGTPLLSQLISNLIENFFTFFCAKTQ